MNYASKGVKSKRNTLCSHLPRASKYHFLIWASISSYKMQLDRECNSFTAITPISCKFNHRRLFINSTSVASRRVALSLQDLGVHPLQLKGRREVQILPKTKINYLPKINHPHSKGSESSILPKQKLITSQKSRNRTHSAMFD